MISTSAPRSARATAIAAPMPWLAPVTRATGARRHQRRSRRARPSGYLARSGIELRRPTMDRCATFRALHAEGIFVIPNPWDIGSAVRLVELGFPALATTSSGFAWSIGKEDQQITLDELLPHVEALAAAVDVPLNVDAERCYAADPAGVGAHRRPAGDGRRSGSARSRTSTRRPARSTRSRSPSSVVAAAPAPRRGHGLVLTAPGGEPPLRRRRPRRHHHPAVRLPRRRRRGALRARASSTSTRSPPWCAPSSGR